MDFAEGEEAVPVTAEVDERRLQRGFDPGYLGEIDIAFNLPVIGGFEIELLNPISLENRHPGFFRVARIDKHARCHVNFSMRKGPGLARRPTCALCWGNRRREADRQSWMTGSRAMSCGAGMSCLQHGTCAN